MSIPPPPDADDAERAPWHLGGLVTIRAAAEDTNGSLAVVEAHAVHGYATPSHVHSREDETLFVIDGELAYSVGDISGSATSGEAVFLPRGEAHHFRVVSEEARFLTIITPGGFERLFRQISPPTAAQRLPGAEDHPHTDPRRVALTAGELGTTVFHGGDAQNPVLVAARIASTATDPAEIARAYRVVEKTVALVAHPLSDVDELVDELIAAARRLGENPVHARSLILLGILAERCGVDVRGVVPALLELVVPDIQEQVALALAYLAAHAPADAPAVETGLRGALSEQDWQRLARCLEQPDFTTRQPLERLGRVWPSPAVWNFDADERALDQQWRATLRLDSAEVRALWESETTALLAFMGARAEHAVERGTHV